MIARKFKNIYYVKIAVFMMFNGISNNFYEIVGGRLITAPT